MGQGQQHRRRGKNCETKRCTNPKTKKGSYCAKCSMRKWRANNPLKSAYFTLRDNAKRRKKEFTITFEEFKKFCYETQVLAGRGRSKDSYHIDRIDDNKGYSYDNIQVLTNTENMKKEHKRRKTLVYDWETKEGKYRDDTVNPDDFKDVPF